MSKTKPTVLLIGYDEHIALSIAYILKRSPYRLVLLTHKKNNVCAFSRFIDKVYEYEGYDQMIPATKKVAESERIDLIMPYDELESLYISKHREDFESIASVTHLTEAEIFEQAINKKELQRYLTRRGLDVMPDSVDLDCKKRIKKAYKLNYPILMKPSRSSFGRGIQTISSKEELDVFTESNRKVLDGFTAQEFVEGSDVTCVIYARKGKVLVHTVQESPLKDIGNYAKNDDLVYKEDQEVYNLVSAAVERLDWNGIACFDLRRDVKTGMVYLLEINGRFWGSVSSAYDKANVNFPEIVIRDGLNLEFRPPKKRENVQFSNHRLIAELKRLNFSALLKIKYKGYFYDPVARALKQFNLH